ncbi:MULTISPECIES: SigB/SigF/SigG family RNA polymerase sigma factor [Streptomyces]|uniref:Putative RNA polymerase sigma factor n=1 Tax=Streptomyces albus (strain ATCC 21838 / DSM 41398 / FERM P-419 / JCM 4703 / NBRC 107858) TaxID=1081613 RepID=A0A0B5EW63_STRA4|nr:SigB/SigF/SigG family RNA polymerase sigma factor [Streptomyces sp. SCSIO ZS0520]AJE87063.1 putative RNA polymerase sigma factor [Streptomyces albus]AOU81367.1 putative RNA polymerase sigma factor [Streptomyces albus]AYN37062.1 SigB/SigF/SigG family RNA polymerase sigma factor [Streptomyces albus]
MATAVLPIPEQKKPTSYGDTKDAFRQLRALPEGPRRWVLRDRIVADWLPMSRRIAAKYRGRGENWEDLCQISALGLVKAVNGFDPEVSPAFETYAVPTIQGEIKHHFRDNTWGVHVPRRVQELRGTVRAAYRELAPRTSPRQPQVEDIADYSGLSKKEVREGMQALHSYRPLSTDVSYGEGSESTLADRFGASDPGFDLVIGREAVRPALARLPDRERRILYMRFFRSMTQSTIAAELGLSQMHVSRLISQACAQVRRDVEEVDEGAEA